MTRFPQPLQTSVGYKLEYAVVPAAGRGSRLGLNVPKLLAPISDGVTVWHILKPKLLRAVDRIHLIVAPEWASTFQLLLAADADADRLSVSVQHHARGMGDAVFGAYEHWSKATTLLVVWGDQIHISLATLNSALGLHRSSSGSRCTIPTVIVKRPYVQYCFAPGGQLTEIRESREGSQCDETGFSDVGVFVLEVESLEQAWKSYCKQNRAGAFTGEVNFLPFLPYLAHHGWQTLRIQVDDPVEARGINTIEDLTFFQQLYSSKNAFKTGA